MVHDLAKADPVGLISKLEHRIFDLDENVLALRSQAEQARSEAVAAAARLGRPFEHQDRLQTLRSRLIEIDAALTPETEATVTANNPGEAPTTTHPGSISDASVVAFPQSRPASIEA